MWDPLEEPALFTQKIWKFPMQEQVINFYSNSLINSIKYIYLLGELMLNQSSRTVSPILSLSPDVEVPVASGSAVAADQRSPSPTGKEEEPWIMFTRHRTHSDAQYEHTEVPY